VYSVSIAAAFFEVRCRRDRRVQHVIWFKASRMSDAMFDLTGILTLLAQLSRQVFDGAVQWARKAEKTYFWKGQRRSGSKVESPRESVVSIRKSGSVITRTKSDEFSDQLTAMNSGMLIAFDRDETQISKLQQLGMTTSEEAKLLAMRDYILKLANAISRLVSIYFISPTNIHYFQLFFPYKSRP
jgi:hypothetical protein